VELGSETSLRLLSPIIVDKPRFSIVITYSKEYKITKYIDDKEWLMHGLSRKQIDETAIRLVTDLKHQETELIETLQKVEKLRLFEDFGLTSLFSYCTERLHLSADRACTYIQVARVSSHIPAVKIAIKNDTLSVSSAKKLAKVITPENQDSWLELAKHSSVRELEQAIAKEKPETLIKEQVKPIAEALFELRCALSPQAEELLTRALDLLSTKHGRSLTRGEAIEKVLESFIERHDPVKQAERALVRPPSKSPVTLPINRRGNRTSVPKPMVHQVTRLTDSQCTFKDSSGKRCGSRRFLHLHHHREVARGGQHVVSNLTLLCSTHHRITHRLTHRMAPRL